MMQYGWHISRAFVVVMSLIVHVGFAHAQEWPTAPVKIIAPYAAGGSSDGMARLSAQYLSKILGQQFVVENRVGANGAIAANAVARASPDGYTLFWAVSPQIVIQPVMTKVSYDPVKDFAPISIIGRSPFVLVVNPNLPIRTVAEFVDYVRKQPKEVLYAEGSRGSVSHLSMVALARAANLKMTNVSYRGNAPALTDVIAGHMLFSFAAVADVQSFVKAGTLRAVAVASEKRVSQLPDVPTFDESGFPGFTSVSWQGLMAPRDTPANIVKAIADAVAVAGRDPEFNDRLVNFGGDPAISTPEQFQQVVEREIVSWKTIIQESGLAQP